MIESTMATGDKGILKIQDKTDVVDKTVDLWIQSLSPVYIPQLPWTYSINGVMEPWKSFKFLYTTLQQHLGVVYVGYAETFVLHLGDTGTSQLAGPTDFAVDLNQSGIRTVSIKVGDVYKQAIPYVNVDGVWTPAAPWVASGGQWKEAT